MKGWSRCGICDEWYNPYGERARIHDHPEPQSGPERDDLLKFKGSYEEWLKTPSGERWTEYKANKNPLQ